MIKWYLSVASLVVVSLLSALPASGEDWVYTVKPGDTLWGLCRQYTNRRNCWQEVGPYNGVDYPPSMAPGTRVRFPVAWLKMQPAPATLLFFTGEVTVQLKGQAEQVAALGQSLPMGSALHTENGAASVQFADGAILFVEAHSELALDRLSRHSATGMVDTEVRLNRGAARAKVPVREPRSQFQIATPSAVAAVRGTEYRVSAEPTSMLSAVYESTIEVTTPSGDSVAVPERFGLVAEKDAPLSQPEALLPAVAFTAEQAWQNASSQVTWQPVEEAVAYRLEWLTQGVEAGIVSAGEVKTTEVTLPEALTAGQCYQLQVRAIRSSGLQGMPAERAVCVEQSAVTGLTLEQNILRWEPIPGVTHYRVELSTSADFTEVAQSWDVTASEWSIPSALKAKKPYFRVVAMDDNGIAGSPSEALAKPAESRAKAIVMAVVFAVIALL